MPLQGDCANCATRRAKPTKFAIKQSNSTCNSPQFRNSPRSVNVSVYALISLDSNPKQIRGLCSFGRVHFALPSGCLQSDSAPYPTLQAVTFRIRTNVRPSGPWDSSPFGSELLKWTRDLSTNIGNFCIGVMLSCARPKLLAFCSRQVTRPRGARRRVGRQHAMSFFST